MMNRKLTSRTILFGASALFQAANLLLPLPKGSMYALWYILRAIGTLGPKYMTMWAHIALGPCSQIRPALHRHSLKAMLRAVFSDLVFRV